MQIILWVIWYCIEIIFFFSTVVRDQDGYVYFRENNGRLLAGGFEPVAKPAYEDGKIPGK